LAVIAASRIGYDGTGFAQLISLDAGRLRVFWRIPASVDSCSLSVEVFNISAALGNTRSSMETGCERREHDCRIQKAEIAEGSTIAFCERSGEARRDIGCKVESDLAKGV
jgi:hypothetical protein